MILTDNLIKPIGGQTIMSITIKKEIDTFSELRELTWCCEFVLDAIEKAEKENGFYEPLRRNVFHE